MINFADAMSRSAYAFGPSNIDVGVDDTGRVTKLNVVITGKVVNLSKDATIGALKALVDDIKAIRHFDGTIYHKAKTQTKQHEYYVTVRFDFKLIAKLRLATPSDHIMAVVDTIPPHKKEIKDLSGLAWRSENVCAVESKHLTKRTAAHELGHLLGLGHPEADMSNPKWLMAYGGGEKLSKGDEQYLINEILTSGGSRLMYHLSDSEKCAYSFISMAGGWEKDFDARKQMKEFLRAANIKHQPI